MKTTLINICTAQHIVTETTNVENVWAIENTFLLLIAIILIAILIAFAHRVNKLEDSIKQINDRFDGLSGTLVEIAKRPCQITDTFGYCVYYSKRKEKIDGSVLYSEPKCHHEENNEKESDQ